jgi:hypothetical protein
VLNTAVDIILKLSSILPVNIIVGNHDLYKKFETDVNSLRVFRHIPNVVIFEKPIVITNGVSKILVIPWVGNKEDEEKYIKANKYEYIFAHTDIAGFQYDNGREIKLAHGINLSKYKNIKRLFSGHIHKRQEKGVLTYIGSPYHTKRSDIGNKKGVYVFDPDKNEVHFDENNSSSIFQRIPLEDILELTLNQTSELFDNNYTDIIVPDKYIHLFNLTKFIETLKDCKYKKIETIGERKKIDESLSDIGAVDIRDILSLLELSIDDLGHKTEVLVKLKVLNKQYYDKSQKEEIF